MSLLTPERVPVKVYKWDDANAPLLDKSPSCLAVIFKACLVTGYGTKEPAGWTMPFEDASAGIKVLRPEVSPHTDFYVRVSADTGVMMTTQVYLNMTDANIGDLKLQCATPFKYATGNSTGKWLLVASTRGFWFFSEQRYGGEADKTGGYMFVGDVIPAVQSARAVYLQHTGGTNAEPSHSNVTGHYAGNLRLDAQAFVYGKLLDGTTVTTDILLKSGANGQTALTDNAHLSDVFLTANKKLYLIPGLLLPFNGAAEKNLTVKDVVSNTTSKCIVFATSGNNNDNAYVAIDGWVY
ncbi:MULTISPECIES: hypothetical protein [unclassified Psychrobacter]|uniref:hypothetical protein n=1 Tax=unclassified Psychrobacter TaxID=196806 RepID=UPI003FCF94BB